MHVLTHRRRTYWCYGAVGDVVCHVASPSELCYIKLSFIVATLEERATSVVRQWTIFSARCNIYISRLCYDVSVRLSVRLSVTEVHLAHYS